MSKTISIIGGGPTGFAVARALVHEPSKFSINVYERQKRPGGVWVYTGNGPMYQDLDTNIFKQLMEYRDRPFPEHLPRYPNRADVLRYIENYSQEIERDDSVNVHWGTTITSISKNGDKWNLKLDNGRTEYADHVVIASGHYNDPLYPQIPGLAEFAKNEPSKVTHTRYYTNPEPYHNQKVLVIGNGSSGIDITIQLLSVTSPIYVSRRKESKPDSVFEPNIDVVWKPEATKISPEGIVTFSDGSSDSFDVLLFATGYLYTLPFLESKASGKIGEELVDPQAMRVQNLYKYIFYINDPTLAFVGLNKQVVPMPMAECQGAIIARVWSSRLKLPSIEEMHEDEQNIIKLKGTGSGYFSMGYPADVEYMHMLNDWADSVGPNGFFGERWRDDKVKMRSEMTERKFGEYARKKHEAVEHRKSKQ